MVFVRFEARMKMQNRAISRVYTNTRDREDELVDRRLAQIPALNAFYALSAIDEIRRTHESNWDSLTLYGNGIGEAAQCVYKNSLFRTVVCCSHSLYTVAACMASQQCGHTGIVGGCLHRHRCKSRSTLERMLVDEILAKTGTGALQLSDHAGDLLQVIFLFVCTFGDVADLDALHLFVEKFAFDEVGEL